MKAAGRVHRPTAKSLVTAASVLAAIGGTTAVALAGEATSPSGQVQRTQVSHAPTSSGSGVTVTFVETTTRADGAKTSPLVRMVLRLPDGTVRRSNLFPACPASVLQSQGPGGCPSGSRVGSGTALMDARPIVTDPINARVDVFNGTDGDLLLYVFPDLGPTFVAVGSPGTSPSGPVITFDIPRILTLPGAPDASVTRLAFRIGRSLVVSGGTRHYLVNPPDCPSSGWTWSFDFAYQNGEQVSTADTVNCTQGTSPPPEENLPSDTATKLWVGPPNTPGCAVKVTYGGSITTTAGQRATFGGNAKLGKSGVARGQEQYQDHSPKSRLNVHSIEVQSITCSEDRKQVSIFGTATINRKGSFGFRIDLKDNGEPGRRDTYRIRLSSGYDSGEQRLTGGNIQIHNQSRGGF